MESNSLWITIPALKHGKRGGELEIPMDLPGVIFVWELWHKIRKGKRVFRFGTSTAWRIVKRIDNKLTPHWFRHNRITQFRKLRDQGKLSTDEMKSWTGIKSDKTFENYGMQTQEGIHRVSKILNVDPNKIESD